ncbi:MAG: UDP-2,3-diacylglucosamine diphosphatase [Candidatus Eisenbacteria bacterium]|nr:UDP-2,3-diacylglucosamine diphosphatase [Candidatus Eisenbacteria bacterium]
MLDATPGPDTPPQEDPAYFLADAHLGIESDELEEAKRRDLLALLSAINGRCSTLFLVGDVFDFWFEYPDTPPRRHLDVLGAMSELTKSGTRVHFLGGNHDYWAGRQLHAITGAIVHHEPMSISCFGKRLFVAHGDGLPRGDVRYKLLKAVIRSRPAIAGFRLLPPSLGEAIARWASGLSEVTEERIQRAIPPMKTFVEEQITRGYDAVVVGHIHRQLMWEFDKGDAIVVGDWMAHRSVVELTADGFRLMTWAGGRLVPSEKESGRA